MQARLNLSPGPVDGIFIQEHALYHHPTMIPHNTRAFTELYETIDHQLHLLLDLPSAGEILFLSCSGTGGIEALLTNVLAKGDHLLVVSNGYFGERLVRMAEKSGLCPRALIFPWDEPLDSAVVLAQLQTLPVQDFRAVVAVHLETATGLLNQLAPIGHYLRKTRTLFLVDAVSSAGVHSVEMDLWGIDALVTVSYKGLLSAPGLSILALGQRYLAALEEHPACASYFFDLSKHRDFARLHGPATTLPSNALASMQQVLAQILTCGKDAYSSSRMNFAEQLRHGMGQLGYQLYGQSGHSAGVSALLPPSELDAIAVKSLLEEQAGIFVGGGLGKLKGQIIRIGHYGDYGARQLGVIYDAFKAL